MGYECDTAWIGMPMRNLAVNWNQEVEADLHNMWVKAGAGLLQGRASGRHIKNVAADFVGLFKSLHARIFRFRGEDDRGENVEVAHRPILSELF